ncbi:MAG: helix-turn-helix transcriptional regulator [Vicinamibacterales bacterium]
MRVGARSIKEVAALLGYSQRSFARFVAARCGETPSALRQRLQR